MKNGFDDGALATQRSLKLNTVATASNTDAVKQGETQARIENVGVISPPNVVGHHNGLGGAQIRMEAREFVLPEQAVFHNEYNPHRPGTQAYVGHVPLPKLQPSRTAAWSATEYTGGQSRDTLKQVRSGMGKLFERLSK